MPEWRVEEIGIRLTSDEIQAYYFCDAGREDECSKSFEAGERKRELLSWMGKGEWAIRKH
jgi:hypothetical protein